MGKKELASLARLYRRVNATNRRMVRWAAAMVIAQRKLAGRVVA